MLVVAYGAGTNSTAMLIEMWKRRIIPDLILFADTGGERPETYWYIIMFSLWLVSHGMPPITTVSKVDLNGETMTLERNCLEKRMLPSLAYGFKTCSQKFKAAPQDKYCNHFPLALETWKKGEKVTKAIGYDANEERRAKAYDDKKYEYWYPLIEWDIGRNECEQIIANENLPQPGKSSCFFCPSMKKAEILELRANHPDLLKRALKMEIHAHLTTISGLGRSFSWMKFVRYTRCREIEQSKALPGEVALGDGKYQPSMFIDVVDQACGCYDG